MSCVKTFSIQLVILSHLLSGHTKWLTHSNRLSRSSSLKHSNRVSTKCLWYASSRRLTCPARRATLSLRLLLISILPFCTPLNRRAASYLHCIKKHRHPNQNAEPLKRQRAPNAPNH